MIREKILASISYVIIFLYVLLFVRMLQLNFDIRGIDYFLIIGIDLVTLLLFIILRLIIKGIPQLIVLASLVIFSGLLTVFLGKFNLIELINRNVIGKLININNFFWYKKYIEFQDILPFLIVGIVIISFSLLLLNFSGKRLISLAIAIAVPIYIWANGGNVALKDDMPILVFLSIILFGITTLYKQRNISKRNGALFKINEVQVLKYILMTAIPALAILLFFISLLGVKSLSERSKVSYDADIPKVQATQDNYIFPRTGGYGQKYRNLGGPITLNKSVAFEISSDKPYYLRGSVKDYYDGYSWEISDALSKMNLERMSLVNKSTKEFTVYPQGVPTNTFFTPLNTIQVNYKDSSFVGSITNTYGLKADSINAPYRVFFNDLQSSPVADYVMTTPQQALYSIYLEVPSNITDKTKDLVKTIIGDSTKNNDKVEKIKEYLKKTYVYSLDVSQLPRNAEFVDYFLFKEKKGYCTYFATAMTIMCRIAGVPARYVEGYWMAEKKGSDGLYLVTNDRAHAWTEILSNPAGDGWESIDPSPAPPANLGNSNSENNTIAVANQGQDLKNILKIFFVCLLIVTLIILVLGYRIKRFLWKKEKVILSDSSLPVYGFILKRLATVKDIIPVYLSDIEFVESLTEIELKEEMRKVVYAYYDEYFGEIKGNTLDNKKIIGIIEEYVYKKKGFLKYYMRIILFK